MMSKIHLYKLLDHRKFSLLRVIWDFHAKFFCTNIFYANFFTSIFLLRHNFFIPKILCAKFFTSIFFLCQKTYFTRKSFLTPKKIYANLFPSKKLFLFLNWRKIIRIYLHHKIAFIAFLRFLA